MLPDINFVKSRMLIFFISAILISITGLSQKQKADSLINLLKTESVDSNRVNLMWQAADILSTYEPQTALALAQDALNLADAINFTEGKSRATGIIANTHFKTGNYPKSLEYNLLKLRIEEKNNKPRNLTSVLMNIGLVHAFQGEYRDALDYYFKADSVSKLFNVEDFRFHIALNMGDTYDRLNILDSAYLFYSNSKRVAENEGNGKNIGTSLIGLGHVYRKQKNYLLSLDSYKGSIAYVREAHDDNLLCEAHWGLALLYQAFNNIDSAKNHAFKSYSISKEDGFISWQLEAAKILTEIYRDTKNIDSAFAYVSIEKELNDSINSRNRIRESQILAMNEQIRQKTLEEEKIKERKERKNRLQLLFIGIFIPAFFMVTLLVSRIRLHIRAIKLLGILSLLFFFEYLTLLLHPTVAALTNHTPVLEILIFVCVAAVLIPLHHKAEHWLIHKLLHRHLHHEPPAGTKPKNSSQDK